MRKLAVAIALASTAMASSALARDKAWYIGAEGGAMIVEDVKFNIGTTQNASTAKQRVGYDVDGIIGYDFGPFRAEAEVAYKQSRVKSYNSLQTTFRGTTAAGSAAAGNFNGAAGESSALSFMINGMFDFGDDDSLSGFIGGGAGVARVKFNDYSINPAGNFLDDSDTVFAWQGIAGIRAPLTDHIDVGLKYRFFNASRVDLVGALGQPWRTRLPVALDPGQFHLQLW